MKFLTIGALVSAALLSLAGCAGKYQTVTPELQAQMMSDLKAGKLALDCGIECRFAWDQAAPYLAGLDAAEQWDELAVGVMKVGFRQDLAYYYLGQAAQGLGYHEAAITYYRYSGGLATGNEIFAQCYHNQVSFCQDVDLAASLPVLIKASQTALAQQKGSPQPTPTGWLLPPPPKK